MPVLNSDKHKGVMTQILKDIYSDVSISSLLGFKGGTAALLFYGLPRFSVDLDFDLLHDSDENRGLVFSRVRQIVERYGEIKDEQQKLATLFFALSYGMGEHQIKVEINTRNVGAEYEMKSYLGIAALVMTRASMCAAKLVTLTRRKRFAARDLYDVYYFLKQGWEIDEAVFREYDIVSARDYLETCAVFTENIPENALLAGLGDLIDERQKAFVKHELKKEVVFLLRARAVSYAS